MRRFELVEGASNKFWEVDVSANDVTTRWGRIGTNGQSKTKTFATPAAAQKEHDELVREKLAKGYHEAGAAAPARPPAESKSDESIPRGNLGRKAHPFRSLGLKRLDIDAARAFWRMCAHYRQHEEIWARASTEDAAMAPLLARVREKLTGTSPALGTTEEETEIAAVLGFCRWGVDSVDDDVIDRWVALGGMRFAVRTMIAAQGLVAKPPAHLERTSEPENFGRGEVGPLYRLRRHLASASEPEWTDAREIARNARTGAPLSMRGLIAYLFPEVAEWANEDATQVLQREGRKRWSGALLMTGVDVALATRIIDGMTSPFMEIPDNPASRGSGIEGAAHSMVAAHGLLAIPALLKLFDKATDLYGRKGVATALALLPSDEALGVLASRLDLLSPMATEAARRFPRRAIPILASLAGRGEAQAAAILTGVIAANEALVDEILPTLPAAARAAVETVRAKSAPLAGEASQDELPRVLGRPPWTGKAAAESKPLLLLFPSKLPALPSFWQRGVFTRPLLRKTGAALPAGAMDVLATMLAFSSLEEPYAGIAEVKEACQPASLGAFAWDLFSAWLEVGAPAKEAWALYALGHLGDDACARRLAPLIREWPGQAAHARAVAGLDVLAAIGSDVALMHLHGIAQKVKFKGLQEKAREKIEELAERRGLTPDELADRLVPDLGLEDDGSMTLDFGPRSFRVGFDEHLRPYVQDAEGKRLPDLPKPGKSDDAEKGREATDRWKTLKKDAKTLAGQQILRLELAMCSRRRFDAEVFRQFFVEHPLVQHLVRRVVWAAYDKNGKLLSTFRVSEDRTFADAQDEAYQLPENASVGVVHPYELTDAVAAAWGQLFGDYEILQPWQQLGREVYRPARGERAAKELTRWTDVTVPAGKVLGLDQRGWRRGPAGDGGVATWYLKPLPPGHEIRLELDPGIDAGGALASGEQTLGEVTIVDRGTGWQSAGVMAFGELDPIVFSELVRDLESLRS